MHTSPRHFGPGSLLLIPAALLLIGSAATPREKSDAPVGANVTAEPTFTKDVAPILQRSCQPCHRPNGVAPMPLVTFQDVQPWAQRIKFKTGLGLDPQAGAMP